ncbi:hypothetical protein PsAD37_00162 [Pseudovibrio sp. Ad37]|nr:hypothetical protein PsAD37_00162 [Pseudovibrio sp. Ad37]
MRYVFQKPRPTYDKLTVAPPAARYVGMRLVWARFEAGGISFLRQSILPFDVIPGFDVCPGEMVDVYSGTWVTVML